MHLHLLSHNLPSNPNSNVHGHLSDDLDVTVGRRRGRRTSSGLKLDGEGVQNEADRLGEPTLGRRTSSKASINSSLSAVPSTPRIGRRPSVAGTPTVRPPLRQRTLSIASSHSLQAGSSSAISDISNSNALTFHGLLRDTSQSGLEKILQSRLVETFLTITLPTIPLLQSQSAPNGVHHDHTDHADDFIPSRVSTPTIKTSREKALSVSSPKPGSSSCSKTLPRRSTITAGSNNPSPSKATTPAKRNAPSTPSGLARSSLSGALPKSASVTSLPNGKTVRSPASPSPTPHKQRSPIPSSFSATQVSSPSISVQPSVSGQGASTPSSSTSGSHDEFPSTPDHISAIHWPSTNPSFQLDARNGFEFAPGADLSGSKMRVEVWGRSAWASTPGKRFDSGKGNVEIEKSNRSTDGVDAKGKGKEKQRDDENCQMAEWKMLEGWDVDLADLVLLPEDLACHPSHLPSNSLLITLSPPGRTFYLPLPSHFSRTSSRAHSPSGGYNSDPESEIRKARTSGEVAVPTPVMRQTPDRFSISPDTETSIELEEGRSSRRKRKAKTAGWQDLLKLINIQTCIIDTEQSLSDVIREIDKLVVRNETSVLTREVSEREAWVGQLRDDASKVANDSDVLRSRIKARREEIRARREMLALARESYERDLQEEEELEDELTAERRVKFSTFTIKYFQQIV
ncbi:hypothetical protein A0H81_00303 [Grifola frondosa]|uniref:Uncharacterized protein n=1 Tax=Grifola frondosa TaxID=5627 RepID=A0A1C7MQ26_GRIFR|nr:hypothetical protein A0H81_00303 [Grifola frondosa]